MLATRFNEMLSTALRKKEDRRKKSKTDDGSPKEKGGRPSRQIETPPGSNGRAERSSDRWGKGIGVLVSVRSSFPRN